MLRHKIRKTLFGKVGRSGFHWLLTPVLPRKRGPETKHDALGGLIVIGLSIGLILLMRFILAR
jgi:hypothetical protein